MYTFNRLLETFSHTEKSWLKAFVMRGTRQGFDGSARCHETVNTKQQKDGNKKKKAGGSEGFMQTFVRR